MDERRAMIEAIALAGDAMPHPNPRVGAIVLDAAGEPVGRGYHDHGPGHPHAEVRALEDAGSRAAGGTLVTTMEPCAHDGRTPPCTAAIIGAGISRVVVGAEDPDERVAGRGFAALRAAGVEVAAGLEREAVEAMDPGYFHHRRTGRPRVTLKGAITLDGQAAAADGSARWISGEDARRDAHRLRAHSDAVMVGAGTVLADDPALTVRLPEFARVQPRPVVVAGRRPLPPEAAVFGRHPIVLAPEPVDLPGEIVVLPGNGGVDLAAALGCLGSAGIVDLMVEGGPTLAGALLRAGLVDRGVFYVAGMLGAGTGRPGIAGTFATLADAIPLEITGVERIGNDVRIEFTPGGS
jgi:diaminohydroxyphosphoribosylaminopyrimidine deaminase/5-amino-6-(5-phosphoribosylamino)uracil reductase